MIQRSLWKRPALQTSEAVLLPALPRMKAAEPVYFDGYLHVRPTEDPFRPFGPSVLARIPICVEKRKADGRAGGRGAFPDGKPKRDRTTPVSFPFVEF